MSHTTITHELFITDAEFQALAGTSLFQKFMMNKYKVAAGSQEELNETLCHFDKVLKEPWHFSRAAANAGTLYLSSPTDAIGLM